MFYVLVNFISGCPGKKLGRTPDFETKPKIKPDMTVINLGKYPFGPVWKPINSSKKNYICMVFPLIIHVSAYEPPNKQSDNHVSTFHHV